MCAVTVSESGGMTVANGRRMAPSLAMMAASDAMRHAKKCHSKEA